VGFRGGKKVEKHCPTATPFLKQGFYGKPVGMWGPNPNRNPNYGGPWLWRP